MRRVHLFELEDFDWVPRAIRDGGTDLLDVGFEKLGFYDRIAHELVQVLQRTGATTVVDLCSGGGGGTLHMREHVLQAGLKVGFVLTDKNPNEACAARVAALGDPTTRYRMHPVDAMEGGGDEAGLRTMSGAMHHFRPEALGALLASVVAGGHPLAFFDIAASPRFRRLPAAVVPVVMGVNMAALAAASMVLVPFVRPLRWSRIALTYVVPAIPFLVAWDGSVSALRAYTPDELLSIAQGVAGADAYSWHSGRKGTALFLVGVPNEAPA